jgi:hypothetical protein
MTSFLQIALSNVVFAALLAMVALAVSRLWKNQHVVHLLWVIVLAKLVTPPLWNVPLPIVGEVVGPATSASVSFDSRASDAFEESAAAVLPDVAEPVETVIDLGVEEAGPSATPIAHAATSQPVLLVDSAQLDWLPP